MKIKVNIIGVMIAIFMFVIATLGRHTGLWGEYDYLIQGIIGSLACLILSLSAHMTIEK